MTSQTLLGALPLALHPAPRDISVIGWGSGVTAHVATLWPGVRQVEAIEIERAVVEAAGFFRRVNGGVVDDRRLRVVYDDARSRLRTASQRFDVIISQPSNPWMVGNADLFTREHYALVKQRLRHGGVFAQWVQLYRIDARSLAAILRTLLGAFSHVQLWQSDHADVLVLASREPLRPSLQRLRRVLSRTPRLRSYLAAWGPGGRAANLLGCYLLGRASLEAVLERFPGDDLTDDRPLLEHRAVRALYQPTHEHLHALYRAKVQRGDLQPPTRAGAAPLGPLIEGALRVIRGDLALAARFSRWAAARHRALPAVRLARAKVLLRRRRLAEAEKLARSLPTRAPWPARAALLRARLALAAGRPRAALAALQRMGQFRPTARRFYQLRAALAAGSLDSGWTVAARLLRGLGDGADPDALQLRRDPLLGREIAQLIRRSRDWRRGLALLQLLPADGAGSYRALVLRLELLDHLGRRRAAAETLDQLRRYGLLERGLLRSCERTYRRAGRSADAAWCAKRARRLLPAVGPPLWRAPAKSGLLTRE